MASLRKETLANASSEQAWGTVRDVGAPILAIDEAARHVVWSAVADGITHYNGSAAVFAEPGGKTKIVWTADFLPDEAEKIIGPMMEEGSKAMKVTLDRLA